MTPRFFIKSGPGDWENSQGFTDMTAAKRAAELVGRAGESKFVGCFDRLGNINVIAQRLPTESKWRVIGRHDGEYYNG